MNLNLIKILSFFIGLFITLLFISYYKIYEPFSVSSQLEDLTANISNISNPLINPLINPLTLLSELSSMTKINLNDDDSIVPYSGYKFMCINTYKDNKILISEGKWYETDIENKYYDYNYNHYFKFNTIINLAKNTLNNKYGALGADIYNNELTGPSCYNFANNSETYELVEFTMFITANIIACSKINNIIFEMTGNTTTINKIAPEYITSIININLIINENKNYDIQLTIGDIIYKGEANNIDKALIEDLNYITIGLFYTKEKIGLILNNKIYEYSNINKYPITLGSTPLIINKYGSINMHLYNFIYYKSLFDFNNYEYLIRYNNYYLSGLNSNKCPVPEITKIDNLKYNEIKYNKTTLPEFKYPILHDKNNNGIDDDDENYDKIDDYKKDKNNNGIDDKIDYKKDKNNNGIDDNIDDKDKNDDEFEKPNILDRIFGFLK